jgi:chromosome segregation ATPase
MNEVLKDKTADSKLKINKFENDLELVKSKAEVQKNYIKKLQDDKKKKTDQLEKDIKEQVLLVECLEKVILLEKKKIKDKDIVETKLTKVQTLREKLYNKKDKCAEEIKFYEDNDQCPTCDQKLDNETKDQHIKKNNNKIKECRNALDELLLQMKPLQTRFNEIIKSEELINDTYNEIHALESVIKRLRSEVKDDAVDDVDIEKERVRLKDIAKEGMTITKDRDNEIDEKYYLDVASILLKDTGIKTKIIRQYLPVMNRIINKYLQAMDFFVSFEIDESFVETIKSRHRDDFSYASFSEGEKQRIDLALMMAWRTIAKMKNSTNTNLLILDEVFDSSLDTSGTELLHQILGTLDNNSNTFVISHRDALFDKFRSVIKFDKQNNFSRIT